MSKHKLNDQWTNCYPKVQERMISDSLVEKYEIVMPQHANPQNTAFGGTVVSWMDIAAAMAACRHAGLPVVTARIDSIDFVSPLRVGNNALIRAFLNYAGSTSMEIETVVYNENALTGEINLTSKAYLTFVALGPDGKPARVPRLKTCNEQERINQELAMERVKKRQSIRQHKTKKKDVSNN